MKYEKPIMDIIVFGRPDVIRTSDITGGGLGGFGGGDNPGTDVNNGQRTSGDGSF